MVVRAVDVAFRTNPLFLSFAWASSCSRALRLSCRSVIWHQWAHAQRSNRHGTRPLRIESWALVPTWVIMSFFSFRQRSALALCASPWAAKLFSACATLSSKIVTCASDCSTFASASLALVSAAASCAVKSLVFSSASVALASASAVLAWAAVALSSAWVACRGGHGASVWRHGNGMRCDWDVINLVNTPLQTGTQQNTDHPCGRWHPPQTLPVSVQLTIIMSVSQLTLSLPAQSLSPLPFGWSSGDSGDAPSPFGSDNVGGTPLPL